MKNNPITPKEAKKVSQKHYRYKERVPSLPNHDLLLDRLRFHGGFSLEDGKDFTGCSAQTVRKHMKRLCAKGKATNDSTDHWRYVNEKI